MPNYKDYENLVLLRIIYSMICLVLSLLFPEGDLSYLTIWSFFLFLFTFFKGVITLWYESRFDNKRARKFFIGPATDIIEILIVSAVFNIFSTGVITSIIYFIPFLFFVDYSSFKGFKFYWEKFLSLLKGFKVYLEKFFSLFKSDYKKSRNLPKKTQLYLLTHSSFNTSKLFELIDDGARLTSEQIVVLNNLVEIAEQREPNAVNGNQVLEEIDSVINSIFNKLTIEINEKKKEEGEVMKEINDNLIEEINALKEII